MPIFYKPQRQAAIADVFLLHDTHNRILTQQPELRTKPNGKGKQLRTGIYSSDLIAALADWHEIILSDTSLGHAGEHLNAALSKSDCSLASLLIMSDALSSNAITKMAITIQ
jgi:transposase